MSPDVVRRKRESLLGFFSVLSFFLQMRSLQNPILFLTLLLGAHALPLEFLIATRSNASEVDKPIVSLEGTGQTFQPLKEGTLRVLLVGGGSSHDFEKFFHQADKVTLNATGTVDAIYTANAEEAATRLAEADVLVLSANHRSFGLSPFQNALNAFADSGKGVVVVHAGVWQNWAPATGFNKRFVGGGTKSHGKGVFAVNQTGKTHPLLEGVANGFEIQDELYRPTLDAGGTLTVLAETAEDPETHQKWPSIWVVEDPKCRIACVALGHAAEAHGNPAYQRILINAVKWTSRH
jgi:type 1 glutamine amidotransferase